MKQATNRNLNKIGNVRIATLGRVLATIVAVQRK